MSLWGREGERRLPEEPEAGPGSPQPEVQATGAGKASNGRLELVMGRETEQALRGLQGAHGEVGADRSQHSTSGTRQPGAVSALPR